MKQLLLVIGVLFLFSACSSAGRDWEAQGGRFVHHKDAVIERSELVVEVRAENGSRSSLSALCYPFFMEQTVSHPYETGRRLGAAFWGRWIQARLFPVMLFADRKWPGKKEALAQARQKNIDLLVCGQVVHFLSSGATGATSLGLRVDIYDVKSGLPVWSLLQNGRIASAPDHDYIFVRERKRMPEAAEIPLITCLADSMAVPIRKWE